MKRNKKEKQKELNKIFKIIYMPRNINVLLHISPALHIILGCKSNFMYSSKKSLNTDGAFTLNQYRGKACVKDWQQCCQELK